MQNVTLKIYIPEKTALDKRVYRVVLPYGKTNLTVLEDRAPTSLVLHPGLLQILNESDQAVESYFIDGGVADIADNICTISTPHIINSSKITADEALDLATEQPQNTKFYNTIADWLRNFG